MVVDAPTAELASIASAELARQLATRKDLFRSVEDMSSDDFFRRNGLLFQSTKDVEGLTQGLTRAAPVIVALTGDPSLRGLTRALSLGLVGVRDKLVTLDDLTRPLSMAAATIEQALAGQPAAFSWQEMLNGQ